MTERGSYEPLVKSWVLCQGELIVGTCFHSLYVKLTTSDVQENVKVVKKRLQVAEEKVSAVDIVINPEARDEEGLPLTEITEELDDDGNVLC